MTREELLQLIDKAADEGQTELDLAGLGLEELPPEIGKCTQLETLVLGKVEDWEWVDGKHTPKLITNQLSTLPEELRSLINLRSINLSSNPFGKMPELLLEMKQLESLNLTSIDLTEIPEAIGKLPNLTKLDLGSNQITFIPEAIAQLSHLTQLYLNNNQITFIPEAIAQLSNLTRLNLSDNQITSIPEAIGQLSNLQLLYLYDNQITVIPEAIFQLSNLTEFVLGNNQISQIPEAISQLFNLTFIYFSNNQIRQIPEALGQLSNLTRLDLSHNQITIIPEAISQLSNLTRLDLSHNQIEKIPECLEILSKLEKLDLRGNPLPISPEVLGPVNLDENPGTPAAIFNYLRQLRSGEVLPLNEAKVLLVGQGSVGKTSLINRLTHNQYNPNQPQTDGLNITNLQITVNTKPVKLNVWDFGGQEIYHATHQFFLTKRSLYLLVSNCRTSEDENRLEYWLKLIESFGDASPVILVGNKSDEQPLDLNRKALRDKYPNIKAIIETSCQSGTGIDELRSAIHTEISQLKEVYDLLPLSWFQVKQRLENLDKDFISISEYATICATENILAETDQTQLIGLLHNLGIVLNFREHPILQSTNILNPHWVTEGIYALLSDDALKVKTKGILTHADLSRILDSTKYPSHRYNCLTELMGEFQLCFPISHCNALTFLIPGILPKEEPKNTELEGETLEFQYHYRILPDSILSRFIVLMHEKIHNRTRWRTGVMLEYTEGAEVYNIARIKSDPEDEKISIAVSGRESTRRSFLSMIRDTFSKIHNSFANLEISQWVPVPGYPDADPLDYEELLGLEEMGETKVRVGKLKLKLDLRPLLDGYESIELRRRRQRGDDKYGREYDDLIDIAKLAVSRPIINKAEAKMTQNSSEINHFQGAFQGANFSGNIGGSSNSAEVGGNQSVQNNNANTAELLKLISSMRETAAQFPEDIRDGIIIDIEDVEAEIKKPESQWNKARLKKSLTAMIAAGTAIAIPIAGMTDFASSAIDLGQKVGIEIKLPPAR
ncbi:MULTISPECIES: COR domain-containing protein [unclassified Microcoleus]|uniref:leucine-rich repeat domain-containing protein n=1 Tax=unclassified Microcoleus TaxID=2642155 RepID=UPI001DD1D1D9|nr:MULTISPECIES: COR domain-containing protein [unclassified Microcoleus]MCC3504776.1 leucine-rich repeat domain-containing protein [Microcoleus sp. PH2017_19_SFW_U_A]MCC3522665.1 leucine-rich repeat domain-containing protein [Microcoleus sp. PH2017_20_SFW_D_A]MCC3552136.1 leucine-rich repeat domain-containing protein [Microcoleus sp. PH2017_35_SFW_U_B]